VVLRNPRTAVGVGADGAIWFVVADGHENAVDKSRGDNKSAGLSIDELRTVMRYLGAKDALNLDGGGSSELVVDGKPASRPSDPAGERKIGDAIVLIR
jgi:exopolysaccharide biosynthesis protein